MRKIYALIFLSALCISCLAQSDDFSQCLQKGKSAFYEGGEKGYLPAIEFLEKAVSLNPDDAEAHYFLGYAYSRQNSFDGKDINRMNLELTMKASEQFETVNRIMPNYTGEYIMLDPYTKLTGEWGTQSMNYWANSKPDSAVWACKEGRKRGAFSDYYLAIGRYMLDVCPPNSILMSSGDASTLPLWYLQTVDKYRTDVKVIDINLLFTKWYPQKLEEDKIIGFGFPPLQRDTLGHCPWPGLNVSVKTPTGKDFSWLVRSALYPDYLLRNERLFLNMLVTNAFKSEVYFTYGYDYGMQIGLKDYLQRIVILDRINYNNLPPLSSEEFKEKLSPLLACLKHVNPNSKEELAILDSVRIYILQRISLCLENDNVKEAKELMNIIDNKTYMKEYPPRLDVWKSFYSAVKEAL
ncbi:MAG: tetratricopeptide repeat protein [Dysgonomonas sp.]